MTRSDWDNGENGNSEGQEESNLVKDLRKQRDEANAAVKELTEQVGKLTVATRTTSLKDVLTSKQLNPKLAVFYPADGEVTAEAVDTWVKEYADVFGIQAQEEQATEPVLDGEQAQLYGRMVSEQGQAMTAKTADMEAKLRAAKTPEELLALLASS